MYQNDCVRYRADGSHFIVLHFPIPSPPPPLRGPPVAENVDFRVTCYICNKLVKLETATTDQRTVHERCNVAAIHHYQGAAESTFSFDAAVTCFSASAGDGAKA